MKITDTIIKVFGSFFWFLTTCYLMIFENVSNWFWFLAGCSLIFLLNDISDWLEKIKKAKEIEIKNLQNKISRLRSITKLEENKKL